MQRGSRPHPEAMRPLLKEAEAKAWNCSVIGISVPPVYRKADSAEEYWFWQWIWEHFDG